MKSLVRKLAVTIGPYFLAALFLLVVTILFAQMLTPRTAVPLEALTPEEAAELEALRDPGIDLENPPVRWVDVDYGAGKDASWWPRYEPDLLVPLVNEGLLPPVEERVGPEPVVLHAEDLAPQYGGTWYRAALGLGDLNVFLFRTFATNLVRWSPQGYPIVPHVAKSFEVSEDRRVFTFQLRRGMRWSDGHPMTADDIMYWWNMEANHPEMRDEPPELMRVGNQYGHVERIDEYSVRFVFPEPNALFLERLATFQGLAVVETPAHYLSQFHPFEGDPEKITEEMRLRSIPSPRALYRTIRDMPNPEHPRLWPWIFQRYPSTPPYTVVRNPYYFAVDKEGRQLPYIDRIFFNQQSSDLIGISAGAGDLSMQERHIRFSQYTLLMANRERNDYELYHWLSGDASTYVIQANLNRRIQSNQPESVWKQRFLANVDFRRALSVAINRPDILRAEFADLSRPSQIGPPRESPFYYPGVETAWTEYDPAKANHMLDGIGLHQRDREGFRTFPDGSRMHFFISVTPHMGAGPAQLVAEDWRSVGVRVDVRERSRELYRLEVDSLIHDFSIWGSNGEYLPLIEPRLLVPMNPFSDFARAWGVWAMEGGYHADPDRPIPGGGQRPPEGHPIWESLDLFDQLSGAITFEEQKSIVQRMVQISADQLWSINLGTSPPILAVVRNDFKNVPEKAIYSYDFLSPGNYSPELFFIENPSDAESTRNEMRRHILTRDPNLYSDPTADLARIESTPGMRMGQLIRIGLIIFLILALVLLALRHPFIGRRLALMVPTLIVVSVVNFIIIQAPPGDYLTTRINQLMESGDSADLQEIQDLKEIFHIDESAFTQYLRWSGLYWFGTFRSEDKGLLQGHMGRSMETLETVNDIVGDRILLTILISFGTILFTWVVAIPLGIYSAVKQYSPGDYIASLIGFIGMCIPNFLLALILMYFSSRYLGITAIGLFSPEYAGRPDWSWGKFVDLLQHIWIPILVVGTGGTAHMLRIMRGNLLDELKKPYVTTARAKGVRPLRLLIKYPVRMALNPFVSGLGNLFPQLVSGSAIVALILSLPTVGPLMLQSLLAQDMYLAGSLLMVLSILGIIGTLVSDLLLVLLDPRIRLEQGGNR